MLEIRQIHLFIVASINHKESYVRSYYIIEQSGHPSHFIYYPQ